MFAYYDLLKEYSGTLQENIDRIIDSSRMILTENQHKTVRDVISRLYCIDTEGVLKKPPKSWEDNSGGRAVINIMPTAADSEYVTDTLVYFCLGTDSLEKSLDRMLIQVGKFKYRNVFFVTTKWDNAMITGINKQRLLDMVYYNNNCDFGTNFTVVLKCPFNITTVLVI